jgi:pantoate--beta-alanine ligase
MIIENKIKNVKKSISYDKRNSKKISLVPTMGSIHKGHIFLIKEALKKSDVVWVSIFINPTQFHDLNDYKNYPRSFNQDIDIINSLSQNIRIFSPEINEMYSKTVSYEKFDFGKIDKVMEGKYRPNHFNGVATVVSKLFDIFKPDYTFFGQKDYQQVLIVKNIINKNFNGIKLITCKTVRETNGLAISSRNRLLDENDYVNSKIIYEMLVFAKDSFDKLKISEIKEHVSNKINSIPNFELVYLDFRNSNSLEKIICSEANQNLHIFICVKVNGIRLIDNIDAK